MLSCQLQQSLLLQWSEVSVLGLGLHVLLLGHEVHLLLRILHLLLHLVDGWHELLLKLSRLLHLHLRLEILLRVHLVVLLHGHELVRLLHALIELIHACLHAALLSLLKHLFFLHLLLQVRLLLQHELTVSELILHLLLVEHLLGLHVELLIVDILHVLILELQSLLFDHLLQLQVLVVLLQHELGDLQLHKHGLVLPLLLHLKPVFLLQFLLRDYLAVPFEEEGTHDVVFTVSKQLNLVVLIPAEVPNVDLRVLLHDESELFGDLLAIIIEESFVRSLALEDLGQHQLVVVDVHQVFGVDADARVYHLSVILVTEELFQQRLFRVLINHGMLPGLFVYEVLGILVAS